MQYFKASKFWYQKVEHHTIQHSYINVYLYVLYLLEVFTHNVKSVKRYLLTA